MVGGKVKAAAHCSYFKRQERMAKFYNHKVKTPDGVFDSKAELERWFELKFKEKQGEITNLRRQVEYEIIPARYVTVTKQMKTKSKDVQRLDERAAHYTADFVYETTEHGYVEDVKGKYTRTLDDYKLRKKLMKRLLDEKNQEEDKEGYWVFVEKVY